MLTPAIFRALVTAGVTAEQLLAAFEADYNERQGAAIATPCNVATLHATKRPKTSTERSRESRARQREKTRNAVQRQNVASVAPPPSLSLVENIDPSREREAATPATKCSAAVAPLPDDWGPDPKSKAEATACVGEAGVAVLTANFRDHYTSRPQDRRTPAAWQATFRKWARSERKRRDGPAELALMRPMRGGRAPPGAPNRGWQPGMPTHEELLKQWSSGNG